MKLFRNTTLCALSALILAMSTAHAQGIGHSGTYLMPPNWEMMNHLPPDQRTKAIELEQKMMQMEAEYNDSVTQMRMKHEHDMMQMQNELLNLFKGH